MILNKVIQAKITTINREPCTVTSARHHSTTNENNDVKLLWDINIQCDHVIEARRPDIVIIDKRRQSGTIVDIAVPADGRVHEKEREKVEKYQELRRENGRLWQLKNVKVVPVVIGTLGSVTKDFDNWMEKLEVPSNVGAIHVRKGGMTITQ